MLRTVFSSATSRFRAGRRCNRILNCLSLKDVWVIQIQYQLILCLTGLFQRYCILPDVNKGLLAECFFPVLYRCSVRCAFDLLSPLSPLSRIWQETSLVQQQSMQLNRILDNVAPGTAVKYIPSCMSFLKTSKVFQLDLTSLTEVQLADILITMSVSRSTSHGSSSYSSVIKALRWLMTSAEVGCLQVVHSVFIGTFLNQKVTRD